MPAYARATMCRVLETPRRPSSTACRRPRHRRRHEARRLRAPTGIDLPCNSSLHLDVVAAIRRAGHGRPGGEAVLSSTELWTDQPQRRSGCRARPRRKRRDDDASSLIAVRARAELVSPAGEVAARWQQEPYWPVTWRSGVGSIQRCRERCHASLDDLSDAPELRMSRSMKPKSLDRCCSRAASQHQHDLIC